MNSAESVLQEFPKISVIVATYNGTHQLDECIGAINDNGDDNLEVVIADDGSSNEGTFKVLEKWKAEPRLKIFHAYQEDKGFRLARARNYAVHYARGDFLLFLDHDIIIPSRFFKQLRRNIIPKWLTAGRRVMLDEALTDEIFSGDMSPCSTFNYKFALTAYRRNLIGKRFLLPTRNRTPGKISQRFEGMAGFCFGVFKEDFLAIDGFDNTYTSYGLEDWDFFARLLNNGVKAGYLPSSATVAHLWHESPTDDSISPFRAKLERVLRDKIIQPEEGYSAIEQPEV
jgi:glycosyltransferase involved in cell wall biosynthesis